MSGKGKELHNFSKLWPELHKLKSTKLITEENTIKIEIINQIRVGSQLHESFLLETLIVLT